MKKISLVMAFLIFICSVALGAEDPIQKMTDDTLQYFKTVKGTITGVSGREVSIKIDTPDPVRTGMRVKILKEGEPFLHPVTKEVLGRTESTAGKVEFREVAKDAVKGVVVEGDAREGDRIRVSETKVKLLFCQDKNLDWYLADDYYRRLKASGRFEMVDTALETSDEQQVLDEAKRLGAEVALHLTGRESEGMTMLRQRLFWVADRSRFIDAETKVDVAFAKELKFAGQMFSPRQGEAVLTYDLPFNARFVVTGDFDGDGAQEIAMSAGRDIRIYKLNIDLQLLWEVRSSRNDDHIWLDTVDLNRNGRDELLLSSMRDGDVVSTIFELEGSDLRRVWEEKGFIRKLGTGAALQAYAEADGFTGDIVSLAWDGHYKKGEKVVVPSGVNLYDFVRIDGPDRTRVFVAYDDQGFMNLFDEKGAKTWKSRSGNGGFPATFKKKSTTIYMDRGEWSMKDRLVQRNKEVLAVQRVPLTEMSKTVGYKSSRIRSYWWNGLSMEESVLVDDIRGTLIDYALAGDRLLVISSPFLGIKFGNILKGENPLVSVLSVYSVKGR